MLCCSWAETITLSIATPFHEIIYSEKGAKIPSYVNFPSKGIRPVLAHGRPAGERRGPFEAQRARCPRASPPGRGVRRRAEQRPGSDLGDAAGAARGQSGGPRPRTPRPPSRARPEDRGAEAARARPARRGSADPQPQPQPGAPSPSPEHPEPQPGAPRAPGLTGRPRAAGREGWTGRKGADPRRAPSCRRATAGQARTYPTAAAAPHLHPPGPTCRREPAAAPKPERSRWAARVARRPPRPRPPPRLPLAAPNQAPPTGSTPIGHPRPGPAHGAGCEPAAGARGVGPLRGLPAPSGGRRAGRLLLWPLRSIRG